MHRRGFLRGIAAAAVQLALPSPKIAGLLVGETAVVQRWVWVPRRLESTVEGFQAVLGDVKVTYGQLVHLTATLRDEVLMLALGTSDE